MSIPETRQDVSIGALSLTVDQRAHLAVTRLSQAAHLGHFPQFGPRGQTTFNTILASLNLTNQDIEDYVRGWGDTPLV